MYQVMKSIDQANGYVFGGVEEDNRGNFSQMMSSAVGTDFEFFRLVEGEESLYLFYSNCILEAMVFYRGMDSKF